MCNPHNLAISLLGGGSVYSLISNFSMKRLATMGLIGEPMAAPCTCSKYVSWKRN